jgi:hypothetical protein
MEGETTLMTDPAAAPAPQAELSTAPQADPAAAPAAEPTATDPQAAPAADADKAKEPEGDKPQGAPEKYEFTAPDGQEYSADVIAAFGEVSKELNLPQEAAQKVLDKMGPVLAQRQVEAMEAAKTEWVETSKADKEFGGEKLNENLAVAKKALDQFATPELRSLLNDSGLGNHPELIRAFYRVGKAISEDGFVAGGLAKGNADSVAQRLYPNMNP